MADRSVKVSGDVTGSVIQTGDRNQATVTYKKTTLPAPEAVDIEHEIAALRGLLAELAGGNKALIDNALGEVDLHLAKAEPERDRVGQALERELDYASKTEAFAERIDKLAPHVKNTCAWLGQNWHKLLGIVGFAV